MRGFIHRGELDSEKPKPVSSAEHDALSGLFDSAHHFGVDMTIGREKSRHPHLKRPASASLLSQRAPRQRRTEMTDDEKLRLLPDILANDQSMAREEAHAQAEVA